jgi:uncharacterized protein YjbJ (UPF0337 family)
MLAISEVERRNGHAPNVRCENTKHVRKHVRYGGTDMSESGVVDKVKGRIKEAAGSLLDDDDLKREGRADQKAGKAKEKADEVVDKARNVVTGEDDS